MTIGDYDRHQKHRKRDLGLKEQSDGCDFCASCIAVNERRFFDGIIVCIFDMYRAL